MFKIVVAFATFKVFFLKLLLIKHHMKTWRQVVLKASKQQTIDPILYFLLQSRRRDLNFIRKCHMYIFISLFRRSYDQIYDKKKKTMLHYAKEKKVGTSGQK